jgi:hypothetical protein
MNRKNIFLLAAVIVFLAISSPAPAWYYAIGGGGGGDADTENLSLELGSENISLGKRRFLAAVSVPLIFNRDDNIPSGTKSSSAPNTNYTVYDTVDEGTEVGVLAKIGMEALSGFYVNVIGGATRCNRITIVTSNTTSIQYEQSSEKEIYGVYGAGISYFPVMFDWELKMNFSLDIDNRRGITGYVGWCW